MLHTIIAYSIRNKLIIGLMILALIGYGIYQITKLPIDAVPDITDNQVQIITTSPALGATDVERFITFPIEQANLNIAGLKNMRSFSRFGLSVVTIVFNDDVDLYWARQQVSERLQQAKEQIPASFGLPTMAPISTGLGEIYQYIIHTEKGYENKYSLTDLRTIQDWIVRKQLLGVVGVAEVASFGGKLKQYEVAIDPSKLNANGVSIAEVFTALESNNANAGGAYIEKGPKVLFIRSEGIINNETDIGNTVIKNLSNGMPLLIKDVATVRIGSAIRYGAMTLNGEKEVAGAVVMMLKGANSSEVIVNVKNRIAEIQKMLPKGIVLEPFLDRTKMVNNAISTVTKNLAEGALIVVFILVVFLGNFRAGFLVASVIPLSMLFAIILMNWFGVSGNLMSLGALDFGLIVDGAVIIVEAVLYKLHHNQPLGLASNNRFTQVEMDAEVKDSASRMMNSAVFGQIIILIVYLPILSLQGIEGKMFKPMALTVAFALIGAFILSLTYIPVMASLALSKNKFIKPNFSDRLMARLESLYARTLLKIVRFPKLVFGSVAMMLVASVFIVINLGGEFIPSLPEGDFAVETRVLPGSNLSTSVEMMLKSEKLLLERFPEIEKIVGKTGSSEIPTDPMPVESSDMMVILKPRSEWTTANNYEDLAAAMSEALQDIPGVTYSFQYPVAMRFNELMTGARQDVVCKIFGENMDTLAKFAQQLGALAHQTPGAENVFVETVTGISQIVITFNRAMLASYGMQINDVNKAINTAFAGQTTGLVFEDEKRFDLVVRLAAEKRNSVEDVSNLLINGPNNVQIPLSAIAKVSMVNGINQIQRENAQRRIIVGFNVRTRDVQSTVTDLQTLVQSKFKLPPGYSLSYGGAFENLNEAKKRLFIAVPVSFLLIFVLLYFAFHSVKQSLLIYSAIPLSAIGGIFALSLRGMPFSISAGVGFIALFGVAVLNGIVLVAEFNRRKLNGETNLLKLVLNGGKTRLRPVLMTACVASFGFLPMALSHGEGAEVQRPLATVVIGGLLLATFLTLYVLPMLYMFFERKKVAKQTPFSGGSAPVIVLIFCLGFSANAQNNLGLNDCIELALKQNLSLKAEQLQADYVQQLKGTAWNLPKTDIQYHFGQINSLYQDNLFNASQSMQFPTVYVQQYKLNDKEWKAQVVQVSWKQSEMRKEVRLLFFDYVYLNEKLKLLTYSDSIFNAFSTISNLRFNAGESNVLEKSAAESQLGQINLQLQELKLAIAQNQIQMQWLIQADKPIGLTYSEPKLIMPVKIDSSLLSNNPLLTYQNIQKSMSENRIKLEKSKLLPDLYFGYNNMSLLGIGANDVLYTSRKSRFQLLQLGIGIPIFYGAHQSSVKAAKIGLKKSETQLQLLSSSIQNQFKKANLGLITQQNALSYYENTALKNAKLIITTADIQFKNGEINYLQWVMLVNSAINIQNQYLESLKKFNDYSIELQYLLNN